MNRETSMAAVAVGVVVVALLAAAVVPGVLADPTDDGPLPAGKVGLADDAAIQPGEVTGQTAELHVETRLEHRGNPASNVTVRFRAIDSESGLVETTEYVDVGDVSREGEIPVEATLTVAREGGYRIETIVFRDSERVAGGVRDVSGLDALTPAYAESAVGFTKSDVVPPVAVSVADVRDNRTTLRLAASLTNAGDDSSEDHRVMLVLRQADSNVVADRATADLGTIRPGRTATSETELTVPSNYNYYVDAVLWKDGVIIDSARTVANLNPKRRISVNETTEDVGFRVEDFESDDNGSKNYDSGSGGTPAATAAESPGFGVGVAVLALLVTALFARRWSE